MISFYHLKLINYKELNFETWYVIILSFVSLYLGAITYFFAKKTFPNLETEKNNLTSPPLLLQNEGRIAFYFTIVFGTIGLIGAFQAWFVLIKLFGSIPVALLRLGALYQMRVSGELEGVWPYTSLFSYSAIFFAAVFSAVKSRITIISALPLIALIIKEIAMAGRAGILFGFAEYAFTFIFTIYFLKDSDIKYSFNKTKFVSSVLIVSFLFITSVTLIKNLRAAPESFAGETRSLKSLDDNIFISPAIYLYTSGHIGVLNEFLEKDVENYRIGENSFQFVYNLLNKIEFTERPNTFQKPYRIPVWINTGTFIRELIADFGFPFTLVIIFMLGFLLALNWNNFFMHGNFNNLVILVLLMIIVFFSFLMMITRLANWYLTLIFLLTIFSILARLETKISKTDNKFFEKYV
jgi:oligosaccharide repeat unit polymerase